jgi:hypothetical protein
MQRTAAPAGKIATPACRHHSRPAACSSSLLHPSSPPPPPPPAASTRRALLLAAGAAAALPALPPLPARAEPAGPRVFFDISVDRKPVGRVVVELDPSAAPIGAQRFADLAAGKEGVGYRRSKIELLQDGYVQDSGLKALSYKASGQTAITGGLTAELLEDELAAAGAGRHDGAGVVSLVVLSAEERAEKERLVAVKGKLVTVTEVMGEAPNGEAAAPRRAATACRGSTASERPKLHACRQELNDHPPPPPPHPPQPPVTRPPPPHHHPPTTPPLHPPRCIFLCVQAPPLRSPPASSPPWTA